MLLCVCCHCCQLILLLLVKCCMLVTHTSADVNRRLLASSIVHKSEYNGYNKYSPLKLHRCFGLCYRYRKISRLVCIYDSLHLSPEICGKEENLNYHVLYMNIVDGFVLDIVSNTGLIDDNTLYYY